MSMICVASIAGLALVHGVEVGGNEVRGERSLSVEATGRVSQNPEDMVRKASRKSLKVGEQKKSHVSTFAGLGRTDLYATSSNTLSLYLESAERRGEVHDLSKEEICKTVAGPSSADYKLEHPDGSKQTGVPGKNASWSQVGQDARLDKVLGSIKDGFFLESGAADGETNSNSLFYEKQGWNGLLIEPNPNTFATILSKNRKAHAFQGGISTTGAIGTIGLVLSDCAGKEGDGQCSTLLQGTGGQGSVQVSIAPLDMLLSCLGRKTVDFWSLDVEGVEQQILKKVDFSKTEVGLMLIEMNKGEENNKGIVDVMSENGFKEVGRTDFDRIYINPKYFTARGLPVPETA